ncbi:hypothetical protein CL652_00110 [bacterium]|nr:hypothetical protein [bacterium]|tara:strand:- start:374 stop:754 length:381 start_codon:yes stop_codon:yes gene_type:complete
MLRIKEKHLLQKIIFGKAGLVALVIVFALFANGTWSVYKKASFARENRKMAEKDLTELRSREAALQAELNRLNTERGLEEELRQKFDVGRKGERLVVLVDAPDTELVTEFAKPTVWEKIIVFFGFK